MLWALHAALSFLGRCLWNWVALSGMSSPRQPEDLLIVLIPESILLRCLWVGVLRWDLSGECWLPFSEYSSLFSSWFVNSLFMMASLPCQPNYTWNQLGDRPRGESVRSFSGRINWEEETLPREDSNIWLQARNKEVLGRSWWDGLPAFSPHWWVHLSCSCSILSLGHSFFSLPVCTEDQEFSTPPSPDSGCWETCLCRRKGQRNEFSL